MPATPTCRRRRNRRLTARLRRRRPAPATRRTDAELKSLLEVAKQALADKQAALVAGDFSAYAAADERLDETVAKMLALIGQ